LHLGAQWFDRQWTLPFEPLVRGLMAVVHGKFAGDFSYPDKTIRLFSALSVIAVIAWVWKRIDRGMAAYVVASLLFLHSQMPDSATARYELALFPVFLLLAQSPVARAGVAPLVAIPMVLMQVFFLVEFGTWRWVA